MERYEAEERELLDRRREMQAALNRQPERRDERAEFIRLLSGYEGLQTLSGRILNELISEIRVGAKYCEDGVKKQKVKIIYK